MHTQRYFIANEADVYGVVLQTVFVLNNAGYTGGLATEVATIVSELAMNIVRHAGLPGYLMIRLDTLVRPFVDIAADDYGRGIENLGMAMRDHFSSSGTLGVGLPGVKRLADEFEIDSAVGMGTRVRVRKWLDQKEREHAYPGFGIRLNQPRLYQAVMPAGAHDNDPHDESNNDPNNDPNKRPKAGGDSEYAVSSRPCVGESVSGDGHFFVRSEQQVWLGMVDVLGHGYQAHLLARKLERRLAQLSGEPIERMMLILHQELRGTLGAAISLLHLNGRQVRMVGVGNIHISVVTDSVQSYLAQPGIVGSNLPVLRVCSWQLQSPMTVIMSSDGISDRIDSIYLTSRQRTSAKNMATDILTVYGKFFDDATCMVWKAAS